MKILVLRVINSSRHRKCFVRGYLHSCGGGHWGLRYWSIFYAVFR